MSLDGVTALEIQGDRTIIDDENYVTIKAAESRYQSWKEAVIESHQMAGISWIQLMDSSFRREDRDVAGQGVAIVKLDRPWYADKPKIKKGAMIALIRMHSGNRVAHLYQLIAPIKKSDNEWRCTYISSNVLGDY